MLLLPSYEGGRIERLAFTPDGEWLVSVAAHPKSTYRNAPLRLWNRYTGLQRYSSDAPPDFRCLALSADGVLSAWEFGTSGHAISIWNNIEAKEQIRASMRGFSESLPAFSRDHSLIATVTRQRTVVSIFSTTNGKLQTTLTAPALGRITDLAFSPDSGQVAVAGPHLPTLVFDISRQRVVSDIHELNPGSFITYSNDGSLLANLKWSGVAVWEPRTTPQLRWRWDRKLPYCSAFAFSPNDQTLAAAFSNGSVIFWNALDGREQRSYQWDIGDLGAIAFAPDGLTCAVGGSDGRIVIWDLDD